MESNDKRNFQSEENKQQLIYKPYKRRQKKKLGKSQNRISNQYNL